MAHLFDFDSIGIEDDISSLKQCDAEDARTRSDKVSMKCAGRQGGKKTSRNGKKEKGRTPNHDATRVRSLKYKRTT